MGKVKNISGEERVIPSMSDRLVAAGQVIEIPDADVPGFVCQVGIWESADKAARGASVPVEEV